MKNNLNLIYVIIILLLSSIVFAIPFTPQGDIELMRVFGIRNATTINATGNIMTYSQFIGNINASYILNAPWLSSESDPLWTANKTSVWNAINSLIISNSSQTQDIAALSGMSKSLPDFTITTSNGIYYAYGSNGSILHNESSAEVLFKDVFNSDIANDNTVLIKAGRYEITNCSFPATGLIGGATGVQRDHLRIMGEGYSTEIYFNCIMAAPTGYAMFYFHSSDQLTLENLYFHGNQSDDPNQNQFNKTPTLVYILGGKNILVQNIWCMDGLVCLAFHDTTTSSINHVSIRNCEHGMMVGGESSDLTINDVIQSQFPREGREGYVQTGYKIGDDARNILFSNIVIKSFTREGFRISQNATKLTFSNILMDASGNYTDYPGTNPTGGFNIITEGSLQVNGFVSRNNNHDVVIEGQSGPQGDITFSNFQFYNTTNGISIPDTIYPVSNVLFSNGIIMYNDSSNGIDIRHTNLSEIDFVNVMSYPQNGNSAASGKGMVLSAPKGVSLTNCKLWGINGDIDKDSVGTHVDVRLINNQFHDNDIRGGTFANENWTFPIFYGNYHGIDNATTYYDNHFGEVYADNFYGDLNASYIQNPPWLLNITKGFGLNNSGQVITSNSTISINSSLIQRRFGASCMYGIGYVDEDGTVHCSAQQGLWTGQSPWLYNTTSAIVLNESRLALEFLNITDQRYNESGRVRDLNISNSSMNTRVTTLENTTSNLTSSLANKVSKTGDNMTGDLEIHANLIVGIRNSCYQEYANVSTSCGGLSSGTYAFEGYPAYGLGTWQDPSNLTDGDWSTPTYITLYSGTHEVDGNLSINYTKIASITNDSYWSVKDLDGTASLTLPFSCFNYSTDSLLFRVVFRRNASQSSSSHYGNISWQCYDGAYQVLRESTYQSYGDTAYEEAMQWIFNETGGNINALHNVTAALFVGKINEEHNLNVNSSNYWDSLDTINATVLSSIGGTLSVVKTWWDGLYCQLSGCTMTGNLLFTGSYGVNASSILLPPWLNSTDQRYNETGLVNSVNTTVGDLIISNTSQGTDIANLVTSNSSVSTRVAILETSLNDISQNWSQPLSSYGMVLYLPFNGNTNDYSGSGNNGVNSGAVFTSQGRFGGAYNFTNDSLTYINVTTTSLLAILNSSENSNSQYTICTWVNPFDIISTKYVFSLTGNTGNGRVAMDIVGISVRFAIYNGSTYFGKSKNAASLNTWVFLCGVKYPGNNIDLYTNGLNDSTGTSTASPTGMTGTFLIGYRGSETGRLNGTIDEFRIWNRSLTANEIKALYSQSSEYYGSGFVLKSGDTMTGTLNIPTINVSQVQLNGDLNFTTRVGNNHSLDIMSEHWDELTTNTLLDASKSTLSTLNSVLNYTLSTKNGLPGAWNIGGVFYPARVFNVNNVTIAL